jgi:NAD(P)H-dependent flavin oxidoreductase YrpB (nitropropane dioxygenase family)
MIGPIQIDRWGQTNLSGIGDLRRPKVQMLGMRGLPGNSIHHANSMFVPNHSKRVFVEGEVDIVGGVGYNPARWPEGARRDSVDLRLIGTDLCVLDFGGPDHAIRVRSLTDQPFGVNFHMFQPGAEKIVATVIAKRVAAVSFGRGPDAKMIARFRESGIRCVPTVGAVKHAKKMEQLGVDMLVVQGGEGGGHTGSVASTILLPQVLDSVQLPVIAAGGFADGRGLAAALAYGAQGIAMGTRFLMTRDCPVPDPTKMRYTAATTDDIVVTTQIDGLPQRMIRNEVLGRLERAGPLKRLQLALSSALALKKITGATLGEMLRSARQMSHGGDLSVAQSVMAAIAPVMFQRSMVAGQPQQGLLATGQVAGRLTNLPSCEELVAGIVRDARERLAAVGAAAVAGRGAA